MSSLEPAVRRLAVQARRAGLKMKEITKVLGTCRQFIWEWVNRANHPGTESFKDHSKAPKNPRRKIEADTENAILAMRTAFNWGTGRIQTALASMPPYLKHFISEFGYSRSSIELSRTAINNVLKKHGKNGSPYGELHEWKFKHASKPNELWQLDLKGPVRINGERVFILVVVDDYSRFDVVLHVFHGDPKTADVFAVLLKAFRKYGKPALVLTDNGGQFKLAWEGLLLEQGVEAVFAHPYYPQDKGKVEREIRNISEELLTVARKLTTPLESLVGQYWEWRNFQRFHMGVKGIPAQLYVANVG